MRTVGSHIADKLYIAGTLVCDRIHRDEHATQRTKQTPKRDASIDSQSNALTRRRAVVSLGIPLVGCNHGNPRKSLLFPPQRMRHNNSFIAFGRGVKSAAGSAGKRTRIRWKSRK